MNKCLLAVAVSILLLTGAVSAVEDVVMILPIRKISRPSLSKVLDRRPGLPNNMPVTPVVVLPPVHVTTGTVSTGIATVITGNLVTGATYVPPVYTGELPV